MKSDDIVVITIILRGIDEYRFTRFIGFSIQDFFFKTLSKIDDVLAKRFHDDPGIKPYSLTTLFNNDKPIYTFTKRDTHYLFRIILLSRFTQDILLKFIERCGYEIELDIKRFIVESYNIRIVKYEKLIDKMISDKFTVRFLTPTCFKTSAVYVKRVRGRGRESEYEIRRKRSTAYYPLPSPNYMFRNLLRIWRKYSSIGLHYDEIEDIISEDMIYFYDSPKGIKIRWVREGKMKSQQGFIGDVTYGVRDIDDDIKKELAALLQLGELTGTGIMRTAGLGTYRVLNGVNEIAR